MQKTSPIINIEKKVLVSKSCYDCFVKIESRTTDFALRYQCYKVINLYKSQNN